MVVGFDLNLAVIHVNPWEPVGFSLGGAANERNTFVVSGVGELDADPDEITRWAGS